MSESKISITYLRNVFLSVLLVILMIIPIVAIATTVTPVSAASSAKAPNFKQVAKGGVHVEKLMKLPKPSYISLNSHVTPQNTPSKGTNKDLGTKFWLTSKPSLNPGVSPQTIACPPTCPIPKVTVEDTINGAPSGSPPLVAAQGLNARDSGLTNGFDLEPPDQALCVGNGFVVEPVNLVMRVYTTPAFSSYSSDITLNSLMGLDPSIFTSDPKCLYDTATGHWFVTLLAIDFSTANTFIYIAVSQTPVPWGFWNIYAINATDGPEGTGNLQGSTTGGPGCPCLPDQPLIGANRDALIITGNEYSFIPLPDSAPPTSTTANGAQIYLIDKSGLALGYSIVNLAYINGFTVPTPDGTCSSDGTFSLSGVTCWSSIQPATSPDAGQYDNSNGGTEYAMSSLDFYGTPGDTRISVWSFWNTKTLKDYTATSSTSEVFFTVLVGAGFEKYYINCPVEAPVCGFFGTISGVPPPVSIFLPFAVPQKSGPIPLGHTVYSFDTPISVCAAVCPEGPLQPNDDRMNQVVYTRGKLSSGLNTIINETFTKPVSFEFDVGIAYFLIGAVGVGPGPLPSFVDQGYVAPKHESAIFPSVVLSPNGDESSIHSTDNPPGLIAFTLSGVDYYPSTAIAKISTDSHGPLLHKVFVTAMGKGPQDGFTEYENFALGLIRPRWGDYTAAVYSGGVVYFAAEYIQAPNCSDGTFTLDASCGGTRDQFANWGTSLNSL